MLRKLEIRNFKCFNEFEMDDIAPITIIGGKNNVGKSAILEAILLQNVMMSMDYFKLLMNLRNDGILLNMPPSRIWNPLFYNMDDSPKFEISYERTYGNNEQGKSRSVYARFSVSKMYDSSTTFQNDNQQLLEQNYETTFLKKNFSSVHVEYESDEYNYSGKCFVLNGMMQFHPDSKYMPDSSNRSYQVPPIWPFEIPFIFKGPANSSGIVEWLSKTNLDEERRKLLVETLQLFDENIIAVAPVIENGNASVYVTLKSKQNIPLNYMGDGINKAFHLLVTILNRPDSIFLIDEIENGLYYKSYEKILPILCEVALKVNCQLIITTHNRNIIGTILSAMQKMQKLDSLCYQRIGFLKDKRKAFAFGGENLLTSFENNMEIR